MRVEVEGQFQGIKKHSEKVLKLFTKEIKRTSQHNEVSKESRSRLRFPTGEFA